MNSACKYKSARNDVGADHFCGVDSDAVGEPQADAEQGKHQHANRKIHRADHRSESVNLHVFPRTCCQV